MKILVITPTLGESRFLGETCASVASLTMPHRHLLVCPETRVQELQRQFPRCEIVADGGRDRGMYGAVNAGLLAAGSDWDWFTYINDDDLLGKDFERVARLHLSAKKCEDAVSYGDVVMMDESGRRHGLISVERSCRRFVTLLHAGVNPLNQQGMLASRGLVERLGGFRPHWRFCGDQDFWLRALAAGFSFVYRPGEVACFRLRAGQLSSDTEKMREEMKAVTLAVFPKTPSRIGIFSARLYFRLRNFTRRLRRVAIGGWLSNEELLRGKKESGLRKK